MRRRETFWAAGRRWRGTWELLGLYSDEHLAVLRCTRPSDFVGPLELDEDLPDETVEWPDCYYPLSADEESPYTLVDQLRTDEAP